MFKKGAQGPRIYMRIISLKIYIYYTLEFFLYFRRSAIKFWEPGQQLFRLWWPYQLLVVSPYT